MKVVFVIIFEKCAKNQNGRHFNILFIYIKKENLFIGNLNDYLNTLQATPGSIGDDAPREVKFTDDNGRVRIGTVTGTSVSSSVSVSTSTNNDEDIKGTIIY